MHFVLATFNRDKLRELSALLGLPGITLTALCDEPGATAPEETGVTLRENALIKARAALRLTGLPVIADDTGLEVDCLKGAPGVYSSRFAGEDASYDENVDKLLREMRNVPYEKRSARFRCVVALKDGGREQWVDGTCEGVILDSRRGNGGFGYDPVFFVSETGKTLAEMTLEEKNEISHRGMALRKMAEVLKKSPI